MLPDGCHIVLHSLVYLSSFTDLRENFNNYFSESTRNAIKQLSNLTNVQQEPRKYDSHVCLLHLLVIHKIPTSKENEVCEIFSALSMLINLVVRRQLVTRLLLVGIHKFTFHPSKISSEKVPYLVAPHHPLTELTSILLTPIIR